MKKTILFYRRNLIQLIKLSKNVNEYGKNYLETGISTTPDFSSFGIASNTPGIDLAEAKMFDTKDDF